MLGISPELLVFLFGLFVFGGHARAVFGPLGWYRKGNHGFPLTHPVTRLVSVSPLQIETWAPLKQTAVVFSGCSMLYFVCLPIAHIIMGPDVIEMIGRPPSTEKLSHSPENNMNKQNPNLQVCVCVGVFGLGVGSRRFQCLKGSSWLASLWFTCTSQKGVPTVRV